MQIELRTNPPGGLPAAFKTTIERAIAGAPRVWKRINQEMRGKVMGAPAHLGYPANVWEPSGRAREQGGETLKDTGRLFRSIVFESGRDFAKYGTSDVRAPLLFEGGTIKPKRAKMLALPMIPQAKNRRPRDFDDLFFWESPRGKRKFLARESGGQLELVFMLLYAVKIPARKFPTPLKKDHDRFVGLLADHYEGK